jgi:uncharacterized protein with GYD domain
MDRTPAGRVPGRTAAEIGGLATHDEVVPMPRFVIFFAYTPETWGRMAEQPGDRTAAVRAAAEAVGARLEALYWMLGEADGMVILEAPDAQTAAAVTLTSASTGAVRSLGTHQLFDQDELQTVLGKVRSGRAVYQAPGA